MNFRSQRILLMTAGLALLTLLAGCYPPDVTGTTGTGGSRPGATPGETPLASALPPLSWRLINVNGQPVPSDSTANIRFGPGNEVSGSGGCNSFGGTYEVDSPALKFSSLISTEMFCEGKMDVERAFFDALSATAGFEWLGDSFVLQDASGAIVASFAPRSEAGLRNTGWVLTGIANEQGMIAATGGVTVVFGADGRISGNAGCNGYGADYNVDGDRLTFGDAVRTLMACEDQVRMDQENAYLAALPKTAAYSINGDVLEFRDASGALLLTFQAAKG